jgi:hypothetical protein
MTIRARIAWPRSARSARRNARDRDDDQGADRLAALGPLGAQERALGPGVGEALKEAAHRDGRLGRPPANVIPAKAGSL